MPKISDTMKDRLSEKQAKFLDAYIKNGGNATKAYISAGYSAKSEAQASAGASALIRTEKMSKAIERRQERRNRRLDLEDDYELKKAMEILQRCTDREKPDFKNANTALMTICRLRGKFVEKKQIDMTLSDRSDWLAEALKE